MEAVVSTRAALLQALRLGAGYGLELLERVSGATGRRLAIASVYPALDALRRDGLARAWRVVPGERRGGRSRTYYELTYAGRLQAEEDARTLRALVTPAASQPTLPKPSEATLQRRLARVSDLIAFTEDLRRPRRGRT